MVLEALLDPKKAEESPWKVFFIGLIYASFALLLSFWVFKGYTSIVMVTLTSICAIPLVYNTIKLEADKESLSKKESWLLREHSKAISAFVFLFLGFVAAFLVWFIILPGATVNNMFSVQIETITHITSTTPTGNFTTTAGTVGALLMNNLKILIFCLLFSFFFGAGSIFILTWNASVVAVAIGTFVRNNVLSNVSSSLYTYSQFISLGLMKYLTHGIFEIAAYFIAALAGGIISIAVVRHDFRTAEFRKMALDSIDILAISILFLVTAALTEVFVTPLIV